MSKYMFECDCRPGDVVYIFVSIYDEGIVDIEIEPQKVDAVMSVCRGNEDEIYTYPARYIRWEGHFEIGEIAWVGQSKGYFLTVEEAQAERLRLLPILNGTK